MSDAHHNKYPLKALAEAKTTDSYAVMDWGEVVGKHGLLRFSVVPLPHADPDMVIFKVVGKGSKLAEQLAMKLNARVA